MAARCIADLPGPTRLPGLGNALSLRADRMHLTLERWCEQHGPLFRFDIGRRPVVCVADPAAINAILRDRPDGFRCWRQMREVLREMTSTASSPPRALAMVARNFQVSLDESQGPVRERFGFTMAPDGLRVRLTPREP